MAKTFEAKGTPQEILDQLVELRKQDLEIEKKKRRWGLGALLAVLLAAATIGIAIAMEPPRQYQPVVVAVVGLFGLAFLVSLVIYIIYGKRDYDNRKLFMGLDVVNFLKRDMPKNSQCSLSLSFDNYQKHGRLVDQDKAGFFGSTSHYRYEDEWFDFHGKLYDGNAFDLGLKQLVKRKERRKRKYTKVKEKFREEITLRLKVDPETYGGIDRINDIISKGASAAGLEIRKAVYEDGKLKIAGRSGTVVALMQADRSQDMTKADSVFQFLFYVYQALGECRSQPA